MVSSLKKAFSRIVAETKGTGTGLSSNGGRLETGAIAYEAQFSSGTWHGDLMAYHVDKVTGRLTPCGVRMIIFRRGSSVSSGFPVEAH